MKTKEEVEKMLERLLEHKSMLLKIYTALIDEDSNFHSEYLWHECNIVEQKIELLEKVLV